MSGYTNWTCVTECYQPVFGGKPGQCRLYRAGEEVSFPSQFDDAVPRQLFDMIEQADAPSIEVDPDVTAYVDNYDANKQPVETLYKMTDGLKEGLNAESIFTIGDLKSCLESKDGEERLLNSKKLRAGAATIQRFKESLGMIAPDEAEEGNE